MTQTNTTKQTNEIAARDINVGDICRQTIAEDWAEIVSISRPATGRTILHFDKQAPIRLHADEKMLIIR